MYESKIRDARWIAYDLPGNAGWIAFLAGLILCAVKRPEITGNNAISAFLILDLLCAAAMVVGVIELISERIQKLDRGFGALTFGGLAGAVFSLLALAIALMKDLRGTCYLGLLCGGGLLCFVFSGLLLREYKKQ